MPAVPVDEPIHAQNFAYRPRAPPLLDRKNLGAVNLVTVSYDLLFAYSHSVLLLRRRRRCREAGGGTVTD
jgi:hypothetical protein